VHIRNALNTGLFAFLLIGSPAFKGNLLNAQDPRPNIILLMADDLGIGDVAYAGYNGRILTPSLDRMAAEGIRFDRYYSQSPVCSPTRGSVLTGRHPFRYGIFEANIGCLREEEITIPGILKEEGYATAHFGKWHLGTIVPGTDESRMCMADPAIFGYEEFFGTHEKVPTYNPNVDPLTDSLSKEYYYLHNGEVIREKLYGDDSKILMDRVLDYIEDKKDRPFFSTVWFHTPHKPVLATPEYKAMYAELYPDMSENEREYYGAISAMDEQLGRLRDSLESWGIADQTLLWFTSDNGPTGSGTTGIYRGAKRHLFEGGVRVPSLMVWPEKIKGSRIVDAITTSSDCFPTVMDALDIEVANPHPVDGISLMPVIEDGLNHRPGYLCFQSHGSMVCMNEEFKLMRAGYKSSVNQAVEVGLAADKNEWMLFDMRNDSTEQNNLISRYPATADSMKAYLALWMESCYDSFNGDDYLGSGSFVPGQTYRFEGGVKGSTHSLSDASLGSVYVNGSIIPGFSPDTLSYSVSLPEPGIDEIAASTRTPEARVDTIIYPLNLSGIPEERTAEIRVSAGDGTNRKYSLLFETLEPEMNPFLEKIAINGEVLTTFRPGKFHYPVYLPAGTEQVPVVSASSISGVAEINIDQASAIANAKVEKRTATLQVISSGRRDTAEYRVQFEVNDPSGLTFLQGITINGLPLEGFSPYICTYYISWPDAGDSFLVEGMPKDPSALVTSARISRNSGTSWERTAVLEITAANGFAKWHYEVVFGDPVSSVRDRPGDLNLNLYPVPAGDHLRYHSSDLVQPVEAVNISGQRFDLVYHGHDEIDISSWPAGIYIITFCSGEKGMNHRVKMIKL